MFKRFLRSESKKVAEGTLAATLVLGTVAGNALTAQADGSSSAGSGGGGTSNSSRAQESGQLGSASQGISGGSSSSTGRNSDGGRNSSGSGSGGSGSGGSGSSSGPTGGLNGFNMSNVSLNEFQSTVTNMGMTVDATGMYASAPDGSWASFSPNGSGGSASGFGGSSTPFLSTWNGKKYEFDNDFLFGKPETSFDTYAEGLVAYKSGKIGGDSYLLKNQPKSENGILKFQIKEIEPEESFIDSFRLMAVDMPGQFYPVTDGNLKDVYIFDITKTRTFENQTAEHHLSKTKKVSVMQNGYHKLGPTAVESKDTTLLAGDSIMISLPINSESEGDTFLLVDSYFRDWSLGNQVPFSAAEMFWFKTVKLTKAMPTLLLAFSMGLFGLFTKETNADLPRYSQSGYGGGGGFSQSGYTGGGGYVSRRSLVISAKVDNEVVYLQTLFPRYVQASQEVVRIPAELIKKAVGGVLEVCIAATKKHKVRSAFLFTGVAVDESVTYTELETISAVKVNTNTDYSANLPKKDGDFLHTVPADVINVEIKDAPRKDGYTRHYLLKADGFYTKMSKHTKDLMGDKWYARLDGESRKLLRNLRVYKS